jgi:hypothetical protein
MDSVLFPFMIGVLVIAVLLVVVILFTKKGGVQLDVNKYRSKWLAIEQQLQKDNAASYQLCVLNADKLLDQALKERGVKGETMGERMKLLQTTWSNANAVWGAHKLRNQVAHESDVQLSYDLARRALAGFKQALRDVGAI